MSRKILIVLIMFAGLAPAIAVFGQQPNSRNVAPSAKAEILRRGNFVEHLGGDMRFADAEAIASAAVADVMGQPADDNHKFFITLITQRGCAPCARLKADFASDKHLQALVNTTDHKQSWAHFNLYDAADKSQSFRWSKVQIKGYPTILIQPPRNGKYGDSKIVINQLTGYDGNGEKLFNAIAGSIRAYVAKQAQKQAIESGAAVGTPTNRYGVGTPTNRHSNQYCQAEVDYDRTPSDYLAPIGVDPPWSPRPKNEPPVTPSPLLPNPSPVGPDAFPFPLDPDAKPDAKPDVAPNDAIPQYAEVVVIQDAEAKDEDAGELVKFAKRLRHKRSGMKFRVLDWKEASKIYPISRDELPVAVVTSDGKVESKILGRLLDVLNPPAANPEQPSGQGLETFPVSSLVALLSGGGVGAAIPIVIWGLLYLRSKRRAAGQQVIAPQIDEAQFGLLVNAVVSTVLSKIPALQKPAETPPKAS